MERQKESKTEATPQTENPVYPVLPSIPKAALDLAESLKRLILPALGAVPRDVAAPIQESDKKLARPTQGGSDSPKLEHEGEIAYNQLDYFVRQSTGKSLYDYMSENPSIKKHFPTEEEFKRAYEQSITKMVAKDFSGPLGLFVAHAEEGNIRLDREGNLQIPGGFAGMNTPHSAMAAMLDDLLEGVDISADGSLQGIGKMSLDLGDAQGKVDVTIDFDRKTIEPPLYDGKRQITFEEVHEQIQEYLRPDKDGQALLHRVDGKFQVNPERAAESAMNIYVNPDASLSILRHEILHALYDGVPGYRESIRDLVRSSDEREREAALLMLCANYDVFDPDAKTVTPDIVIDEAFNAYQDQGTYDPKSTEAKNRPVNQIIDRYGLTIDLGQFGAIDDLPVSSEIKERIEGLYRQMYPASEVSEQEFLRDQQSGILSMWTDMAEFRDLLVIQQALSPNNAEFLAKLQTARAELLDWVDRE